MVREDLLTVRKRNFFKPTSTKPKLPDHEDNLLRGKHYPAPKPFTLGLWNMHVKCSSENELHNIDADLCKRGVDVVCMQETYVHSQSDPIKCDGGTTIFFGENEG